MLVGILLMRDILKGFPYYTSSDFKASYYGFDWVQPDPNLILLFESLLPFTTFCIIVGLFYRIAMPLTAFMAAYFFLIAPEYYLNHYYMLLLFLILMSFIPAHKTWSLDSIIKKQTNEGVPVWSYLILKLQTEVILIYAGLVKINYDWLQLQPLGTWLRIASNDLPYIKWIFFFDTTIAIGAYGVILLHVLGAPLLFWHKTRPWVFALYVCFHLTNSMVFNIGIFPYLTIAATLLFFNPDWPKKIINWFRPFTVSFLRPYKNTGTSNPSYNKIILPLCSVWMLVQILNPLPALLASNVDVAWRGHGDIFTWRMMLNDRRIHTAAIAVHMPEKHRIEFVHLRKYLGERQCYMITWRPNTTVQFAHFLKNIYSKKYDTKTIKIHAYITVSINDRVPELWADPTENLAAYNPAYGVYDWQEPTNNPLRTWKEVVNATKYTTPTYNDTLKAMKLPQEKSITFNTEAISLHSHLAKSKCE